MIKPMVRCFRTKSKMFSFITATINPLGGNCKIGCSYCWARSLAKRLNMKKYLGEHRLFPSSFKKKFKEKDFVFVCTMVDLFESTVPACMIQQVLDYIEVSPATFLLLTKNPKRYFDFRIPLNCVCGATIETDLGDLGDRFLFMRELKHPRKMVSVEPILRFSPLFLHRLIAIGPEFVAVGYDNYDNKLDEPSRLLTEMLISNLEAWKIKVYRKTIREKWNA